METINIIQYINSVPRIFIIAFINFETRYENISYEDFYGQTLNKGLKYKPLVNVCP